MTDLKTMHVGEFGTSQSHRAEAKRLAAKALEGMAIYENTGRANSVSDGIALGQLHAILAVIDSLDEIRAAIGIVAAAR